jgi:hypothetical protein
MCSLDFLTSRIIHDFIIIIWRRVESALAQLQFLQCRPFLHQTCLKLSFRLDLFLIELLRSLYADSFLWGSFFSRVSVGGEVLFEVFLRKCKFKLWGLLWWHVFFDLSCMDSFVRLLLLTVAQANTSLIRMAEISLRASLVPLVDRLGELSFWSRKVILSVWNLLHNYLTLGASSGRGCSKTPIR